MLRVILETLLDETLLLIESPPRSGKTTLASQLQRAATAAAGSAILVDASAAGAANILREPGLAFKAIGGGRDRVLIVDNADRDQAILEGLLRPDAGWPRMVLLGTGFPPSLALPRLELGPLGILEVGGDSRNRHWLRGGYPEAYFAHSDAESFAGLMLSLENLAESRVAGAGLPWEPGRSRNLLSMLALSHGEALNENAIARSLGVSRPTVARSLAKLARLGILRVLPSLPSPEGKRTRRSGAFYLRDSGHLHAILGIGSMQALVGNPRLASSWEGYVIEQALTLLPQGLEAARYRSQDGAGLELVIMDSGRPVAGAAIRWASHLAAVPRGVRIAAGDLGLEQVQLVLPEADNSDLGDGFQTIGLPRFLEEISSLGAGA